MDNHDDLFDEILAKGPSPETVFLILSQMKKLGSLHRVIQECRKALESYPEEIRIRRLLADCYIESGRIPQAEAELNGVVSLINCSISSYRLLADILIRQKREKEAVEFLKIYLAHRPDDQEAVDLLETITVTDKSADIHAVENEGAVPDAEYPEDISGPPDVEGLPEIATST